MIIRLRKNLVRSLDEFGYAERVLPVSGMLATSCVIGLSLSAWAIAQVRLRHEFKGGEARLWR